MLYYESKQEAIEGILSYPIFSILKGEIDDEEDEDALTMSDCLPQTNLINFKILCDSLATTSTEYFDLLYEKEVDEVYEYFAVTASKNHIRNQKMKAK